MATLPSFLTRDIFGLRLERSIAVNAAALKIQCIVRVHQSKQKLHRKLRRRFVKVYDSVSDEYVYKDKKSGYIHLSKPLLLGDGDIQTPRVLAGPNDYDPKYFVSDRDGHAIIITVSSFAYNDVIPDLPIETVAEHIKLREVLSHDFICQLPIQNVTSLLNPTCDQLSTAFKRLRRVCKTKDHLLIYICTHVVTAFRGEKNKKESGYLLMHDSTWGTTTDIANTSISLSTLILYLNSILSREKTLILNCAHQNKQQSHLFAAKDLYPPHDFFSKLADLTNSVVISNCSTGSRISAVIDHTTPSRMMTESMSDDAGIKSSVSFSSCTPESSSAEIAHIGKSSVPALRSTPTPKLMIELSRLLLTRYRRGHRVHPSNHIPSEGASKAALKATKNKYMEAWGLAVDKETGHPTRPMRTSLTWKRQASQWKGDFLFELPSDKDVLKSRISYAAWILRRAVSPVSDIGRRISKHVTDLTARSPAQVGLLGGSGTLFGQAFIAALEGGASREHFCNVTSRDVFSYIENYVQIALKGSPYPQDTEAFQRGLQSPEDLVLANKMQQKLEKKEAKLLRAKMKKDQRKSDRLYLKAVAKAEKNGMEPPVRVALATLVIHAVVSYNQTPMLTAPRCSKICKSVSTGIDNVVAARCCVPPAPDRPMVTSVGPNDVHLSWTEPAFSGAPSNAFKIFFRNGSRNFSEWTQVPNLGNVLIHSHHVRGLTKGITYEFRVRAYNNGGWGTDSEPSDFACPGSSLILITTATKRQRLAMGGPLTILDYLGSHPIHREDHLWGLSKLVSFAQMSSGYARGDLQKKMALAAIHGLHTFADDPDVAGAAISLMGWSLTGPASEIVSKILVQNNITDSAVKWMSKHCTNSNVIGATVWLRFHMPAGTIPRPQLVLCSSLASVPSITLSEACDEDEDT